MNFLLIIALLLFPALVWADSPLKAPTKAVLEEFRHFYQSSGIQSELPPELLSHQPTKEEIDIFNSYIVRLPALHQKVLHEVVDGIYIIDNLPTRGFAQEILTGDRLRVRLFIRTELLHQTISEMLTIKERSVFSDDDSGLGVTVEVIPDAPAIYYFLLHELAHPGAFWVTHEAFGIPSPYEDAAFLQMVRTSPLKDIQFYSSMKVPASDALSVYRAMSKLPIASLYSVTNGSEDAAEIIAFYHLAVKDGREYKIRISDQHGEKMALQPTKLPEIQNRLKALAVYYDEPFWSTRKFPTLNELKK